MRYSILHAYDKIYKQMIKINENRVILSKNRLGINKVLRVVTYIKSSDV